MSTETASTILTFWFEEIPQASWWKKDENFDALISERFTAIHQQAVTCELYAWRDSAQGRLAEIIILDQFSRNMYRDTAASFAADPLALALAQEAVRSGVADDLTPLQRVFLYMPYMHSESLQIHELAVQLFASTGLTGNLEFEHRHKAIIERFGRYPHRNKILGRLSTDQEVVFLKEPGSSF